jgi:hypothetical protein
VTVLGVLDDLVGREESIAVHTLHWVEDTDTHVLKGISFLELDTTTDIFTCEEDVFTFVSVFLTCL